MSSNYNRHSFELLKSLYPRLSVRVIERTFKEKYEFSFTNAFNALNAISATIPIGTKRENDNVRTRILQVAPFLENVNPIVLKHKRASRNRLPGRIEQLDHGLLQEMSHIPQLNEEGKENVLPPSHPGHPKEAEDEDECDLVDRSSDEEKSLSNVESTPKNHTTSSFCSASSGSSLSYSPDTPFSSVRPSFLNESRKEEHHRCLASSDGKENVDKPKNEEAKSNHKPAASRFGGLINSNNVNGHDNGTQDASTAATGQPSQVPILDFHLVAPSQLRLPVASSNDHITTTTSTHHPTPSAGHDDAPLALGYSGQDRSMTAAAVATAVIHGIEDCGDNINNGTKNSRTRKSISSIDDKYNDGFSPPRARTATTAATAPSQPTEEVHQKPPTCNVATVLMDKSAQNPLQGDDELEESTKGHVGAQAASIVVVENFEDEAGDEIVWQPPPPPADDDDVPLALGYSGQDRSMTAAAVTTTVIHGNDDCGENINKGTQDSRTRKLRSSIDDKDTAMATAATTAAPAPADRSQAPEELFCKVVAELLDKSAQPRSYGDDELEESAEGHVGAQAASIVVVHNFEDEAGDEIVMTTSSSNANASQQHGSGNEPQTIDTVNHASSPKKSKLPFIDPEILAETRKALNRVSSSAPPSRKDGKAYIKNPEKTLAEDAMRKRRDLKPTPVNRRPPRPPPSPFEREWTTKRESMGLID